MDARSLARIARLDRKLLEEIRHRRERTQIDLELVRARDVLVTTRTRLINHVRGVVKSFGKRLPACEATAFPRKVTAAFAPVLLEALTPLLQMIESLTAHIRGYDRAIEHLATIQHPQVAKLRQVSGVGALTGLAFALTVDDPHLLVGSAQYILGPFGPDCDLRRHGLAIAARGGKNSKKRAAVAVARKLAVLLHKLWVSDAVYEPLYNNRHRPMAA